MESLTSLQLESNAFHGDIPSSFCNLRKLDELTLCNSTGGGCSNITGVPGCLLHMGLSNLAIGNISIYYATRGPTKLPTLSPTFLPTVRMNNTSLLRNDTLSGDNSFIKSNMFYVVLAVAAFMCCLLCQIVAYLHFRHSYFGGCLAFLCYDDDDDAESDGFSSQDGIRSLYIASASLASSVTAQQSI